MVWRDSSGAAAVTLLLCMMCLSAVEGNYRLEILMLSYRNPTSMALSLENFRHGCCERDAATPCNPCDNAFRVCVRETPRMAVEGDCDLEMESELLEENDDELTFTIGEEVGGLNNPIRVSGEMWPGTLEVVFSVFDLDLTTTIGPSSDVVDNIFVYPEVAAVPSSDDRFSDPVTYTGNASYSSLELAFRLTCGQDHYGPDCTYCVPMNDSVEGHYTCNDETGARVCLEGYRGTQCAECIPAENCSSLGGYCELPGDCLCRDGYFGDSCSDHVCLNQTCSGNGTCRANDTSPFYSCDCEDGYLGDDCQFMEELVSCDPQCQNGDDCVNGSCVCVEGCDGGCELECGENGECVRGEGDDDRCDCKDGYSFNGELCEASPTTEDGGRGSSSELLVIVVATVGGLLFILIVLVVVAICVLLFRGRKIKEKDEGTAPNPYETPFFRKFRGNGHTSNRLSERKFENPLYHERTHSPASPPLPPRPQEHPYATLEDITNSPYAQIPAVISPDEKPPQLGPPLPELAVANHYDRIGQQSPATGGGAISESSTSPRLENPYLDPVNSAPNPEAPPTGSDNAMNSSTILYAHIQ